MDMNVRIPLSRPEISDEDVREVLRVLRSPYLSLGPYLEKFEKAVANYIGVEYAVAVSSGTAALHLLVKIAGLGKGDFMLTTPFTFVSSANVALFEGALPVFADIDIATFNIDPQAVEDLFLRVRKGEVEIGEKRVDRIKVFMGVDIFGQPVDWDRLGRLCVENDVVMIEDACEALGAEYKGKKIGAFGLGGAFAFYPNKQITTGEGGIILTNHEHVFREARSLRNQGRGEGKEWLLHIRLGYNYRMDEMSAALGFSQLKRIDDILEKRKKIAERYNTMLCGSPIEPLKISDFTTRMSWFVYVVKLPKGVDRDRIMEYLEKQGIQTRPYFQCVHLQPFYRKMGYHEGMCPAAEEVSRRTLALPFYNTITPEQQEEVISKLMEALERVG